MVNPNEGCAIADVNRDGRPDVIAGTHWFAAPKFTPRPVRDIPQIDLGFGTRGFYANNGDHAYDLNGDGWVDVVSGGWKQEIMYWYENPGEAALKKGWKWEQHLLAETGGQNEAFDLADIDDDKLPEVIRHTWDRKGPLVAWDLRRTEGQAVKARRIQLGEKGCGHGYAVGDLNQDGRTDIVCEAGWYERPDQNPLSQSWRFHPETALKNVSSSFVVGDVNGDGRNDLVWGKGHDYGLYWWEQREPKPDGTTTWSEHQIDDSWSQTHTMTWADLDRDGQGEVIAGKRVRGHGGHDPGADEEACLYYFDWDASKEMFVRHTISPPGEGVGTGMQIRVADLNSDDWPDIAVAGKTGTWILFNEGE